MASVYGIGNPLMDIIIRADSGSLRRLSAVAGSMNLVGYEQQQNAIASGTVVRQLPGGSCANTIRGIQWLLRVFGSTNAPAYTGGIGRDRQGVAFETLLDTEGVHPLLAKKSTPTGSSAIVVTPDSQRTMFTYLGACRDLNQGDVDQAAIKSCRIFHTTGYMWDTSNQEVAVKSAVASARSSQSTISFDVADSFVVDRYRDSLISWIPGNVDILFANRDELARLTGVESEPAAILDAASSLAPTVVMKVGPRGCLVLCDDGVCEQPAYPAEPTDTTGAGDAFAAGFLFGVLQRLDVVKCAFTANRIAAAICTVDGCNYDALRPEEIRRSLVDL